MEMELDFSKIELEIMSSKVYLFGGEWSAALALSAIYPFRGCDGFFVFLRRPGLSFPSKVRSPPLSLVLQNTFVKRLVFFCHE